MKKLIVSIIVLLTGLAANAQEVTKKCGTDEAMEWAFSMYPELRSHYEAQELLKNSRVYPSGSNEKSTPIYEIPVVFHVLHEYGTENITDAQVYDALEVINREYNSEDPDSVDVVTEYKDLIGNAKVIFKLAAKDPFGNCTNGIEHIYSHETRVGDAYSKVNQWNRSNYLNIWVVKVVGQAGAAAYALKPAATDGTGFWMDGIVSNHTYVGSIGTGSPFVESTLSHEIGHYFDLSHTWGNTNDPGVACGDDGVYDTPVTKGWTTCPIASHPNGWIVCGPVSLPILESTFKFDSIVPTSGTTDPTPVPTPQINIADPTTSVLYSNFTAVGVGTNPTGSEAFGFDSWDTGAADGETVYTNLSGSINTAKYYEFSVAPEVRGKLNLEKLVFDVARDNKGPRTFAVRWDIDGYAANLDLTVASSSNADITVDDIGDVFFYTYDSTNLESGIDVEFTATEIDPTNPVTFRIYAWNAEDATGDFIVDNVRIDGSVGLVEDLQNYMEYAYCDRHFTPGQVEFMHNALEGIAGQRNMLWQEATLIATGVQDLELPQTPTNTLSVPTCVPVADFSSDKKMTCQGGTISFKDASWNALIENRNWTFQDGTPATSTSANPSVTFNTPGWKTVTLTVSNAAGSDTRTSNGYIYVGPGWADYVGPVNLNMESQGDWFFIQNPEDNYGKFKLVGGVGYNGSKCYKLENYKDISGADPYTSDFFYNGRLGLSTDNLISPSVELLHTTGITVKFKYAYATNATLPAEITEKLTVYSSRDCGATWTTRKTITGTDLVTAGFAGNVDFAPSNNSQWEESSFSYTATSQDQNTRFKFEFTASDLSSNLYIDDVEITGTLGVNELTLADMEVQVFPNPSSGEAINIAFNAPNEATTFILRDVQGKVIATKTVETTNSYVQTTLNNTQNLPAACYFLEVLTGGHSMTKKVIVL